MSSHPETWPKTVEEAVYVLTLLLEKEDKEIVRQMPEEGLPSLHFGIGIYIRNNFGLWQGNKDLLQSCGTDDPDDASMTIIKALQKKLREATL